MGIFSFFGKILNFFITPLKHINNGIIHLKHSKELHLHTCKNYQKLMTKSKIIQELCNNLAPNCEVGASIA
jgi:hypothetical protein